MGVVTEVIVDVAGRIGQIAYVLVAPKHPAVSQSELRALPWSALSFDPARHCFTLEVSSTMVRDAPEAISRGWPIMPDEQWKADVRHYYRPTEPYAPGATQANVHGQAPGPNASPTPGLAQESTPGLTHAPVEVPIEPPSDPDTEAIEHDFLPELGLTSPFRRRTPGPK